MNTPSGTCLGLRRRGGALLAALAAAAALSACSAGLDFPAASNPVSAIPWPDYELLRYDFIDETGVQIGILDLEVERQGAEYQIRALFLLDGGNVRDETVVRVAADTLQPIQYERLATDAERRIHVLGNYHDGVLDAVIDDNGERKEERVETGEFAFDNDTSAHLWRSIALTQDYQVVYRSVNVRQRRSQLVRLRVVGQDLLRVPAGEFLAWQIEVRPGLERQSVWYAVDPPHVLVRWDQEPRSFRLRAIVTEPESATASP